MPPRPTVRRRVPAVVRVARGRFLMILAPRAAEVQAAVLVEDEADAAVPDRHSHCRVNRPSSRHSRRGIAISRHALVRSSRE